MKIGFDGRYAESNLGGVGNYIKNLTTGLARRGEKVTIFYSQKPKEKISGNNITAKILPSKNRYFFEQVALPKALRQEKINLYHAAGNTGIPLFCPIPSILTVHDIIPLLIKKYFHQSKHPFLSLNSYRLRLLTSCLRANKIITDSKYTQKLLTKKLRIKKAKIAVINLGVKIPSKSGKLPRGIRKKQYILNNGGIDERKNLNNLLDAFAIVNQRLPSLKLVITGKNPNLLPLLKRKVQLQNLKNSVIFTGFVKEPTLRALIKNAICLCYPSSIEGFGMPIIEGFAIGTPVIASNIAVLREIGDSACLFIDQNRPQTIGQAIIKLTQTPKLQKQLIARGKKRAKIFSWEKTVNETIKIYNKVLGKE